MEVCGRGVVGGVEVCGRGEECERGGGEVENCGGRGGVVWKG